jgi:hypothetical protein
MTGDASWLSICEGQFGQTLAIPVQSRLRRRRQPYISCAEYRNLHLEVLLIVDLQGSGVHVHAAVAIDLGSKPWRTRA